VALIYRSHIPGVLLILGMVDIGKIGACIIGVVAGIVIFLQGLRLLRRRCVSPQSHQGVETIDVSSHGFTQPLQSISVSMGGREDSREASRERSTAPEVSVGEMSQHIGAQFGSHLELVRLSPEPTPLRASEMSQQQKIAAALFKAGMSNPTLWATADTDKASGFDPNPFAVTIEGAHSKRSLISWRSQQQAARALGWKYILMIFIFMILGGPALALLSLHFLLKIKSLF